MPALALSSVNLSPWLEGMALTVMVAAFAMAWRSRSHEERMQAHEAELEKDAERMQAQAAALQDQTQAVQAMADASQHSAQQAQELATTVIEAATVAIIGMDQNGSLLWLNEAARSLTGYTQEELGDESWLSTLFPGDSYAPAHEALSQLMEKGDGQSVETGLMTHSGQELQISWQCRHVLDHDEWLTLLFGVNMTDRLVAERERRDLERKLLDMQKLESLGVLAGGIAHDFNNLPDSHSRQCPACEASDAPCFTDPPAFDGNRAHVHASGGPLQADVGLLRAGERSKFACWTLTGSSGT